MGHRIAVLLLIFASLMTSPSLWADALEESCRDVDYSDRFVPPRNQGHSAFCYSFAAGDLLGEAMNIKPPNTVSAFHTATQYMAMTPDDVEKANQAIKFEMLRPLPVQGMGGMGAPPPSGVVDRSQWREHNPTGVELLSRQGGHTDLSIAHMLNLGKLCLESEVPSQIMLRSEKDTEQKNFFVMQMARMAGGDEWAQVKPPEQIAPSPMCFNRELPEFSFKKDVERLHSSVQDWATVRLRREADQKCKNPIVPDPHLKVHSKRYNIDGNMMFQKNDEEAATDIKNLLDNQRPFALHYNACILQSCGEGANNWHASTVVGRRWNKDKKRCELKIKNSWGASCENALPSVECRDGYWWVGQQEVTSGPHEIIWIEKK